MKSNLIHTISIINKYKTSWKGKWKSVFHISIECACGLLGLQFGASGFTLPSVFSSIKLVFICDFALVLYGSSQLMSSAKEDGENKEKASHTEVNYNN